MGEEKERKKKGKRRATHVNIKAAAVASSNPVFVSQDLMIEINSQQFSYISLLCIIPCPWDSTNSKIVVIVAVQISATYVLKYQRKILYVITAKQSKCPILSFYYQHTEKLGVQQE